MIKNLLKITFCALSLLMRKEVAYAQTPKFRALAFYSTIVESDHVDFAKDAIAFYSKMAAEKGFAIDTTQNWDKLNTENLKNYKIVIWLNDFPHTEVQRQAFEKFMENGGCWIGFHVSGYNDKGTHWPWYVNFLGELYFTITTGHHYLLN